MQLLLTILSLVAYASGEVEVQSLVGFHERIAIPMATKLKAAEDAYIAGQSFVSRIVGGMFAEHNAHPYLGGLVISYRDHFGTGICGSSLISRTRLVTAAHCWFDGSMQASGFMVVLGTHFLFSGGQRIATTTVEPHPQWDPTTLQNDIAVIYLRNPVLLSRNVQVIALASNPNESFNREWAVAAGYGKTSDEEAGVTLLAVVSEVNLQVITVEECQAVFGSFVQPNHICTSGVGGVGICGGDTGGPLFVERDGERVLIGVGSFVASAGCQRGFPSGFTRVTNFYDFLTMHLQ